MLTGNDAAENEFSKTALVPHSYPHWVKFFLLTLLMYIIYAISFLPETFKVKQNLQLAEKAYKQNNHDQAIIAYLAILQKFPHLRSARIGAAESLFSKNHDEDASRVFAIELLTDITLKNEEYARIKKVMPKEYEKYFCEELE